jgi:hypothetical protein
MHRRPVSWLVIGAGTALLVCTLLAHNQLAAIFTTHAAVTATALCHAAATGQPGGVITRAQTVGAVTIVLTAAPDPFGSYTFTVTAQGARCAPLQGAKVDMMLTMLDMPMAPLHIAPSPVGPAAAGAYQGQGVLMTGRWQALVRVFAQSATRPLQATFHFTAR